MGGFLHIAVRGSALMLLLAAALPGWAQAESKEGDQKASRVRPRPDPGAVSVPAWDGPQMLLVDGKGQVSILRGDTLQVYPLEAEGSPLSLVGERAVSAGESKSPAKFVRSAATGAKGDSWVLLDGTSVRWFDKDGEKELDAPEWMVDAVTMAGDDPVAFVLPNKLRRQEGEAPAPPPLLLRWDGQRWNPWAEAEAVGDGQKSFSPEVRIERSTIGAPSARGRVWVANTYRYRVRQLSPGGRVLTEIRRDGGVVQEADPDEVLRREDALLENIERSGRGAALGDRRTNVVANPASPRIRAVAEGPDRRLYLLVHDEDRSPHGLAIDRYDPTLVAVERLGLVLQWEGATKMVAGESGLHLAPFNARDGERRFISWEELDAATWSVLPGVEISSGSQED